MEKGNPIDTPIGLRRGLQGMDGCKAPVRLCCHILSLYTILFPRCLLLDLIVLSIDKQLATFSDGCLGSNTDEGRSEV